MTALTGLDDIINSLTSGSTGLPQNLFCWKDAFIGAAAAAAPVAGRVTSLWQYNGIPSGNSNTPGAVANPTNITTGSLRQANPRINQLYLVGAGAAGVSIGTLLVYDRLAHISGLNGTTITPQTVSASLTRYSGSTTSIGNQIWVEINTQIGATTANITATYKNQSGATSVTPSASFGNTGFREAQRFIQLPLAPGDTGVQAVNSVIIAPSTGTAGDFGVVIVRPLTWIPMPTNGAVRDLVMDLPSIVQVEANACLAFAFLANTTTAIQFMTNIKLLEK